MMPSTMMVVPYQLGTIGRITVGSGLATLPSTEKPPTPRLAALALPGAALSFTHQVASMMMLMTKVMSRNE